MKRVRDLWTALAAPTSKLRWTAASIGGAARVAKTPADGAALLVPNDGTVDESAFGLKTTHVTYETGRVLAIEGEGSGERPFLVLECAGADQDLLEQFLLVADTLQLAADTAAAFDEKVRSVFELFRSFTARATGTPQGVWAELLLFLVSKDPEYLAAAWHADPDDLHDFVADGSRLEVKSTVRPIREHEFSLEQLERAPDATVIASVLLVETASGVNVMEILEDVLGRIAQHDLRVRVNAIARKTLGETWRDAIDVRFDYVRALEELAFYEARQISRVPGPLPAGVRNVRFSADLSNTPRAGLLPNHSILAMLPKRSHDVKA